MLKKFNNRLLIIIFVILLAIVGITEFISSQKGERNFREYLAQADTAAIDKIEMLHFEAAPLVLQKVNDEQWKVKQDKREAQADKAAVANVLKSLSNLKVKKRVAIKEAKWDKYEVTDSLGTRVKVYTGDEMVADLMVGRFSYKRRGRGFSISSNARLYDEEEVYTVEGRLSMMTRRDFNGFRNHTILSVNPASVNQITFNYPADSSFTLVNDGKQWIAGNVPADSATVIQYLKKLKSVKAHNFIESFNAGEKPHYKMSVELKNGTRHTVEAYKEGKKYVLRASQNENAVFKESKNIFSKIFKSARELQATQP